MATIDYAGERFSSQELVSMFAKDARAALERGDVELAERLAAMAQRFSSVPPEVLHLKEFSEQNSGPEIRKCTECGRRLWIQSDGKWVTNRRNWETPPPGYINCLAAKSKEGAGA